MAKCPRCNSCLEHTWYKNLHFLWCFLCQKYYILRYNSVLEVKPDEEVAKFEEGIK